MREYKNSFFFVCAIFLPLATMFVRPKGFFCRYIPLTGAHRPIPASFVGCYPFKEERVPGSLTFVGQAPHDLAPHGFP
jgi:hypothetical protein